MQNDVLINKLKVVRNTHITQAVTHLEAGELVLAYKSVARIDQYLYDIVEALEKDVAKGTK